MSKYAAFMAGNAKKVENKKIALSARFLDENGKPELWEIKALPAGEVEDLQRKYMINVPVPGKEGTYTRELDMQNYILALTAACVVEPNLNYAELQDSYGVKNPVDLLGRMLFTDEYTKLVAEVRKINSTETIGELVEKAKN
ncbi:MAG: phage portal protein [Clostridia bacterium]|nr:phage portal protein [Clostridia bacterium]